MAELCTRKRCVSEIEDIVMRAKEKIVLISPYIKADPDIVEHLKRKSQDVEVVVIYGKEKDQPQAKSLFEAKGLRKIFVKELHSKCYLNEKKALVTSMNLYEYSQNNNEEMGVLVTTEADEELYEDVIELVEHWEAIGEKQFPTAKKQPKPESKESSKNSVKATTSEPQHKNNGVPKIGYCIRCGNHTDIEPSDLKPYCSTCYYKYLGSGVGDKYKENFCHFCRKSNKTTLKKPACRTCYDRYEEVVKFEASTARAEKKKHKW